LYLFVFFSLLHVSSLRDLPSGVCDTLAALQQPAEFQFCATKIVF